LLEALQKKDLNFLLVADQIFISAITKAKNIIISFKRAKKIPLQIAPRL